MVIKRNEYLSKIIRHKNNGLIKVITGMRRVGKSYLLFNLFYDYLVSIGIDKNHIITYALDDRRNKELRNPDTLLSAIDDGIKDDEMYYILLDEIQMVDEFEDVLNSLLHIKNVDTYVTGSNSKFLSKDLITEFRGRSDEIRVYPLTFKEFMSVFDGDVDEAYEYRGNRVDFYVYSILREEFENSITYQKLKKTL